MFPGKSCPVTCVACSRGTVAASSLAAPGRKPPAFAPMGNDSTSTDLYFCVGCPPRFSGSNVFTIPPSILPI
eukprot:9480704-Pyramimonas_sp.AAC.1